MENIYERISLFFQPWLAVVTAAAIYCLVCIARVLLHPLRDVPGPVWARLTRLWYLRAVNRGNFEMANIDLHRSHGPVVRIAPGQYSFDDPDAIRIIYSHSSAFVKAPWYLASANPRPESHDLFTDVEPRRHAANRRRVATLYSMTSLIQMETCVSECTAALLDRLTEFAQSGQSFNLQHWMQFYAFDAIGLIMVNKRFGFLDTHVGIYHEVHPLLSKLLDLLPAGGIAHLVSFTLQQISNARKTLTEKTNSDSPDPFLKKLLDMHAKNPDKISKADIFTTCITNIGAGSDTTSVSLTAVLYNLCKHPNVHQKLLDEIRLAEADGKLSSSEVTFQQSQALPYLQACIKEALRLHPATGLPLARVVPKGGVTLSGRFFPEGEIVGVNAWVAHRNRAVFGNDADSYRPERWIENPARLSEMERNFLAFGAGARTCIGKNISLMEICKLVPQLIRRFDFELVDPEAEAKTKNVWFVKQLDIKCRVRLRHR